MVKYQRIIPAVMLIALLGALLSCQAKKPALKSVEEAKTAVDIGSKHATKSTGEPRSWPGSYPGPAGLKGLRRLAVDVYAAQGIPADRIAAGPFREEIEKRIVQKLRAEGIALVNKEEADAVLSASVYLSCEADGLSCAHLTTLELRQRVQLERDPSITVVAITWHNSYTNAISREAIHCCLPDMLAVDVGSLMLGFLGDYRTANPK